MSRSYKNNILVSTCLGDNRDFYKLRRRKIKNAWRMQFRSLKAHYSIDEVNDRWIEPKIHMRDTWAEPTDGHYGMNMDMYLKEIKQFPYNRASYYTDKVKYYLKRKERK